MCVPTGLVAALSYSSSGVPNSRKHEQFWLLLLLVGSMLPFPDWTYYECTSKDYLSLYY
jgi:hypothetical protein